MSSASARTPPACAPFPPSSSARGPTWIHSPWFQIQVSPCLKSSQLKQGNIVLRRFKLFRDDPILAQVFHSRIKGLEGQRVSDTNLLTLTNKNMRTYRYDQRNHIAVAANSSLIY